MAAGRFVVIVVSLALVAIVAVLVSGRGLDLGAGDGSGEQAAEREPADREDEPEDAKPEQPEPADPDEPAKLEEPARPEPKEIDLPENPDDVRGSDAYALTRTRKFRRALSVIDRERRRVEGVFESVRVAPGRIDTVIVHPDDRLTNIQVRADLEISFRSTHDFPTQADFRERGLTGGMLRGVDPSAFLRAIDRVRRRGDAEEDVDYLVLSRDIIDGSLDQNAYMRVRSARPRCFAKEGRTVRAIG